MPLCTLCGEDISNPRVELDLTSLNDKLRSQYGPASAQPDEVNSIVQCLQQDLKDYHSKLPTELSTAVPHARCISSYEVKLGSLLSPIRRLPYEVLHEIFDKCCVANYFEITNPGKKPECSIRNRPALALSSVCARWRRIVLSTPSLWARISLDWNWDVYGEVDPHADPLFSRFATFISRSLQRPMTVNFVFRERPYFEGSDSRLHPILELLVKQIHRWQSFSYQAPVSYVYSEDLFPYFRGVSSSLRSHRRS
ncbi:hypothetical protein GYMLUDRAFT_434959 [Collybiopsis luxurians FD-317 M1]|uniref:F-box domain-containing protein n=1 Tax=Collybiopsis luxurians FD-317 M1 TaxID=944289 RepID=A0A0D0BJ28_9AGAR|nr:hypothetical protein GYMLUDRAFT_434959 [Collybiopsis luxurians FD-317 M1]